MRYFLGIGLLTAAVACSDSKKNPPTPPTVDVEADNCSDGHFSAPASTLTLPAGASINYPDIQKSFPDVDWTTLDRLYVMAGNYKTFNIGNLPDRKADHPLVITNLGGQVKVGPNIGGNFLWSMDGGSNWVLTGRYDEQSKTGDVSAPGHRCSNYAESRGRYGFLSDDGFDESGAYLHMGLAVSNATAFTIEFVEVTSSGFAGIRLLNSHDAGSLQAMDDVSIHDNYIHDTLGEGFYFGWTGSPPSSIFHRLQIYANRIIRTGNEALQIQDLGDGAHVYNNVMAYGGLAWLFNGLGAYQDNNSQLSFREGTILVENNVFLRGPGSILNMFSAPQGSDGDRDVTFTNNYFADTSTGLIAYLNGTSSTGSSFTFENNWLRDFAFDYTQANPDATASPVIFGVNGNVKAPVKLLGNTWEGSSSLAYGITGGDGTSGVLTASGNINGNVTPIAFADSGYPAGASNRSLRLWSAKATIQSGAPTITYAVGDIVVHLGVLYRCTATNTDSEPPTNPTKWQALPTPVDDFRSADGSPYESIGVR